MLPLEGGKLASLVWSTTPEHAESLKARGTQAEGGTEDEKEGKSPFFFVEAVAAHRGKNEPFLKICDSVLSPPCFVLRLITPSPSSSSAWASTTVEAVAPRPGGGGLCMWRCLCVVVHVHGSSGKDQSLSCDLV